MIENLPGEVLSDIFIRLLAKQLAQMRSVCKSWNALLSESSFIKSHLRRLINKNDGILLFFRDGFSFDRCSLFTARPTRSPHLELKDLIKLPVNLHCKNSRDSIIGSVNGLICFYYTSYHHDYVVHVWNPSLSAMLTLPPCSVSSRVSSEIHFGFGFDPKTDDYKVVKLTSFPRVPTMVPKVEVYSMRKGSWELMSERFPSHVTIKSSRSEVCADGHDGRLHWLGYTDLGCKRETIVTFDLSAETFREIPLPDSVLHHHEKCMNVLGVLHGKLCVMSRVRGVECEVWVMDEYGVSQSWVKHHAFSQFSGNIKPFGFTSHGEFLFHVIVDRFALYDPIAVKAKTFKSIGGEFDRIKVVEYVDSLVWVIPAKREMSC